MDRLILFRHGKAEAHSADGEDFSRRLAPRGEREAAETGRRLAEIGFSPDLVLVSSAARTRETWTAAEPAFPGAEVRFDDGLYHAEAGAVLRTAEAQGRDHATVMVVGHNPGLHELASELLADSDAPGVLRDFPTSAAAVFRFTAGEGIDFDGLLLPDRGA